MNEVAQTGWTRMLTRTGRYEYQFQGRLPAVRQGRYEDASDYQFLLMDEGGWLYKISVRLAAAAEAGLPASSPDNTPFAAAIQIAELQLRAGLENYRPRPNAPYAELDAHFAVDAARATQLAAQL